MDANTLNAKLCPNCKQRVVDEDIGNLCWPCAKEKSKVLFSAVKAGGQGLDKAEPEVLGEQIIPFDMKKPIEVKTKWCGCEVIMRYDNGSAVAVRMTTQEQKQVSDRIFANRRTGHRDLQVQPVMVFDIDTAQNMINIVEAVADGSYSSATVSDARTLIEAMKS